MPGTITLVSTLGTAVIKTDKIFDPTELIALCVLWSWQGYTKTQVNIKGWIVLWWKVSRIRDIGDWGGGCAGTILDWVDRDSVPKEDDIWRETWMEWGSEFCNKLKKAFQDIRMTNTNALMLEHSWHIPWNQEGQVSVVETMREGEVERLAVVQSSTAQ